VAKQRQLILTTPDTDKHTERYSQAVRQEVYETICC